MYRPHTCVPQDFYSLSPPFTFSLSLILFSRAPFAPSPTWVGAEGDYSSLRLPTTAPPSSRPYETSTTTSSMTGAPFSSRKENTDGSLPAASWASCPTSPATCVLCRLMAVHGTGFCLPRASFLEPLSSYQLGPEPTPPTPVTYVLCRLSAVYGMGILVLRYCVFAWLGLFGLCPLFTPLRGGTFDLTFCKVWTTNDDFVLLFSIFCMVDIYCNVHKLMEWEYLILFMIFDKKVVEL